MCETSQWITRQNNPAVRAAMKGSICISRCLIVAQQVGHNPSVCSSFCAGIPLGIPSGSTAARPVWTFNKRMKEMRRGSC